MTNLPSGKNQSFWAQRTQNRSLQVRRYPHGSDVDYTNSGIDSIANPIIRGLEESGNKSVEAIDFAPFFGAPLQRGKLPLIQSPGDL